MVVSEAIDQDLSRLRERTSNPISAGTHGVLVWGDYGVDRLIDESDFHRLSTRSVALNVKYT